jgi:hypothetical protein
VRGLVRHASPATTSAMPATMLPKISKVAIVTIYSDDQMRET